MSENVTLIDPTGAEYVSSDPVEVNDLVYGQGYQVKAVPEKASPSPHKKGEGN